GESAFLFHPLLAKVKKGAYERLRFLATLFQTFCPLFHFKKNNVIENLNNSFNKSIRSQGSR
ncbi:MAG: hypothetical protein KBF57_03445, partial [Saprospiraceae bacterium]|nr:hypothetical protein [Saprospiraceae bacterium]